MTTYKLSLICICITTFTALQFGNLPEVDSTQDACSAVDLELVTLQRESIDAVMTSIQSVFPRLSFTMQVKLHLAPPISGGLHTSFSEVSKLLYEVILNVYALNGTKSGLNKFMEAISEISSGYTTACSGPLEMRPTFEDIPKLMKEFATAYKEENSIEIRFVYGQILCLNDILSISYAQMRHRRQTPCPERENCSCPNGGPTEDISCLCEFFDCLDKGDQLKPLFLDFPYIHCLAFVIDTTGSMKDELNLVTKVIKDFIGSEEDNTCYFIIPFNDNGTGPGLNELNVTFSEGDNTIENINLIQSLESTFQKNSGGDCREYSFEAIKWILDYRYYRFGKNQPIAPHALLEGSQLIVLTDAPPKGDELARYAVREEIVRKASDSGVCVHFFLPTDTFNCLEDYPEGVEEYKMIANDTGGVVIDSGFTFSQFASIYSNHRCKHVTKIQTDLKGKRDTSEDLSCHLFQVSSLSRFLKVTAKTKQKRVIVTRPDNTTMELKVLNSRGKKEKLALFSEAEPLAGGWKACVDNGSLEIAVDPGNRMDFTAHYFAYSGDQNSSYLTVLPPPGCTVVKMAVTSSKSNIIDSAQIQLLDESTKELGTYAELDKCGSSWIGNITQFSIGNYAYQLEGQDVLAIPFVYFSHQTVEFKSGLNYYTLNYTGKEDVAVEIGERVELTFQLGSTNPYGPTTFNLKTEEIIGFSKCYTEPSEITLLPSQTAEIKAVYLPDAPNPDHEPGSSYVRTSTLTASNGCVILSVSKNYTIMDPNVCGCVNGGTCSLISFGSFQFPLCTCPPGFRGSKCEYVDQN